ncbi:MAG: TVP38/TMEM64 family protein [Alphaproteobacteria bacterium]|nr:TVP38/TMEM64 family protein [Alphaproteobacteria bacterium]
MSDTRPAGSLRRFMPIAAIVAAAALFFASGLQRYVTFEALAENRAALVEWTVANRFAAAALYFITYVVIVAGSLPGGAIATLAGGFLFGTVVGGLLAVAGATLGACLVFLAARTALGDALRRRAGPTLERLEAGFRRNALSYLLFLRLVPAFPFFLVNLAPAFLGMKLRDYALGTFFGIVPGTFVFASVGAGLGSVFERGERPDLGILLSPPVLLPLLALAALSLLPVFLGRRAKGESQ